MDTTKNKVLSVFMAIAMVFCLCFIFTESAYGVNEEGQETKSEYSEDEKLLFKECFENGVNPFVMWLDEGFNSYKEWSEALSAKRQNPASKDGIVSEYEEYIDFDEDELSSLDEYSEKQKHSTSIAEWEELNNEFTEFTNECEETKIAIEEEAKLAKQQSYSSSYTSYYSNGSGLTKSSGVNYYNGRKETYYSSRVLYHYRTSEWTVDSEGCYRTSNGYYVVAASDMKQGTTFEGSKGTCIVLDSGCAAGTTDYYVAW